MGRSVLIIVISVCSTLALNFAAVAKDTGGGAKGGAATTTKPVTNKSAAQQNSKYKNVYLGMRKSGGDPKSAGKPF